MRALVLLIVSFLVFSCHDKKGSQNFKAKDSVVVPASSEGKNVRVDSGSVDFLINSLKNEKPLNSIWENKLEALGIISFPLDSMSRLAFVKSWTVNDSVTVIIFSYSTGTGFDEFLLTFKNKRNLLSSVHVGDADDSDLSPDRPYYYTEYEVFGTQTIKLFNHKVVQLRNEEEVDKLISTDTWFIEPSGKARQK